ncbi:MAG: lysophospholipase, partial [ANME-2 cluster archaeon]|nr:lysophospholipase [ANME-2 cluster archaeon]
MVHGETPIGRKLPICRILAKKLVERGYIVLTYDRRGIGESDDPERIELVESWDESNDIFQAVSYIYSIKNVDKSKIYAIGHSGGSFSVMQAGLRDKRIKKIVVIGPPRRIEERLLNRSSPDLQYLCERKSRYRGLQEPIPLDTYLSIISDLQLLYDEYIVSDHIPIFLIDGELENYDDKLYLRNYFSELKEPKKYHTVNGTGHYLNTSYVADFMLY